MDIHLTVDVEIWCDGWNEIDSKFPSSFRRYVYGTTPQGEFGLPRMLQMLRDHGLHATFFTEPLFAARFGLEPLREIVELIAEYDQDIQLHLHTEWVDEALEPILPPGSVRTKRPLLSHFTRDEQQVLIGKGAALLEQAGAPRPKAFRAGSFGFNRDTLAALPANGIFIDSSYNATQFGPESGVAPGRRLYHPALVDGVYEYPISVFQDGLGHARHAQIGACAFSELRELLERARLGGWDACTLLFHNFEMLNQMKDSPDWIVVRRFEQLFAFLADQRATLPTKRFDSIEPPSPRSDEAGVRVSVAPTLRRYLEQAQRRIYG